MGHPLIRGRKQFRILDTYHMVSGWDILFYGDGNREKATQKKLILWPGWDIHNKRRSPFFNLR